MTARGLIGMVAVGAALVGGAALLLGPGAEQAAPEPGVEVAAGERQRRLGVQGEAVDAERRTAAEDGAPAPIVLPAVRPEAPTVDDRRREEPPPAPIVLPAVRPEAPTVDDRRREEPPPAPAPATPPNAEALARSEAILAARPKVQAAVEGALADQHDELRRRCWSGGAAGVNIPIEASYGADGAMLALSVRDDRAAPGVGSCVSKQAALVPAKVEAPGVGVTVQATLRLP